MKNLRVAEHDCFNCTTTSAAAGEQNLTYKAFPGKKPKQHLAVCAMTVTGFQRREIPLYTDCHTAQL